MEIDQYFQIHIIFFTSQLRKKLKTKPSQV